MFQPKKKKQLAIRLPADSLRNRTEAFLNERHSPLVASPRPRVYFEWNDPCVAWFNQRRKDFFQAGSGGVILFRQLETKGKAFFH